MTKIDRAAIIALIDADTSYDATTVCFHRDGSISAIKDADKTFNTPETVRETLGVTQGDFAAGANPFRA